MLNERLYVKYIPVKNCFVRLPSVWLKKITSSQIGIIKVTNNDNEYYLSYAKSQSSPCNILCISATFAKCLNIIEGEYLNVSSIFNIPIINSIVVTAQSEEDLSIIKLRSDKIQEIILNQINIIGKYQPIVIWLSKSIYVKFIVKSIIPNYQYGKLQQNTEVHVLDTIDNVENSLNMTNNCKTTLSMCNKSLSCELLNNNYQYKIQSSIFRVCFISNIINLNINDTFNIEIESIYNIYITLSQAIKYFPDNVDCKIFFANIKLSRYNQQNGNKTDLNLMKLENVFNDNLHIIVRVLIIDNAINYFEKYDENILKSIIAINDNNIIVSQSLKKQLNLELGDRIILKPITIAEQEITQLNILPFDKSITRQMLVDYFKKYYPSKRIIINSGTIISLTDNVSCIIQLPDNYTYTLINEDKINDIDININDVITLESLNNNSDNNQHDEISYDNICLQSMEHNISNCRIIFSMTIKLSIINNNLISCCENILICGNNGIGKTTICKIIIKQIEISPYYFYTYIIDCKKLKGKKVDVINKLFTNIMKVCQYHQPSILFIDDLDIITNSLNDDENSPDSINAARIADNIMNIIVNFQSKNLINVLATCANIDKLGNQFRSLRGVNLFRTIIKIPQLSQQNRCDIIKSLLINKLNISNDINWNYFGNKTEGWTPRDLIDLVKKATFTSWKRQIQIKNDNFNVVSIINNDDLLFALRQCVPISLHGVRFYSGNGNNWSDIGSLKNVKDSLVQLLQWPLIYSRVFKHAPINQQSGILLYGMPGTGKTMIAGAIAKECGINFINIKGPELLSKYIGASEEAVRDIFHKAQCAKPCVLFFDEFDSLAPRRGHDSTGVTDRVVNQLLTEFDGVEGRDGVAIVAASSRPDLLDPALLRPGRLDKSLLCPLPGQNEREEIVEALCNTHNININELNVKILAEKCENFTGADLNAILIQARMNAIEKCNEIRFNENFKTIDEIKITQDDLMVALDVTQPSLTPNDIEKFNRIYSKFSKNDGSTNGDHFNNLKSTLA